MSFPSRAAIDNETRANLEAEAVAKAEAKANVELEAADAEKAFKNIQDQENAIFVEVCNAFRAVSDLRNALRGVPDPSEVRATDKILLDAKQRQVELQTQLKASSQALGEVRSRVSAAKLEAETAAKALAEFKAREAAAAKAEAEKISELEALAASAFAANQARVIAEREAKAKAEAEKISELEALAASAFAANQARVIAEREAKAEAEAKARAEARAKDQDAHCKQVKVLERKLRMVLNTSNYLKINHEEEGGVTKRMKIDLENALSRRIPVHDADACDATVATDILKALRSVVSQGDFHGVSTFLCNLTDKVISKQTLLDMIGVIVEGLVFTEVND